MATVGDYISEFGSGWAGIGGGSTPTTVHPLTQAQNLADFQAESARLAAEAAAGELAFQRALQLAAAGADRGTYTFTSASESGSSPAISLGIGASPAAVETSPYAAAIAPIAAESADGESAAAESDAAAGTNWNTILMGVALGAVAVMLLKGKR